MTVTSTLERKTTERPEQSTHRSGAVKISSFLIALPLYLLCLLSTVILPMVGCSMLEQHSLDPKNTCLKVKRFLTGGENPDVLVFGSSLMSSACVFADAEVRGRTWPTAPRPRVIFFYNYDKCHSLETGLKNKGWPASTSFSNMSYPGLMISEQYRLFQSILQSGKTPRFVILSVAPRDFYSNDVAADTTQRPVFALLSGPWSVDELNKKSSFDVSMRRLADVSKDEIRTYRDMWTDQVLFADSVLKDSFQAPSAMLRKWLNGEVVPRLLDVFDAEEIGNELGDLDYYKIRYQPANEKMFAQESQYLQRFIALAKQNHVSVILVDMPITMKNWSLIPPAMQAKYRDNLVQAATATGVSLVTPDKSKYSLADFIDSVHLNARGGQKLFDEICSRIGTAYGASGN
ncbi:MAG: hypothetical protein K2W95_24500 [Candidatus Obscuribacterales bacterium]|nr:hypothetical protein [Candidatus Obscuribacterales bacterium]